MKKLGGITGITVAGVIFTGVIGAVLAPLLVKLLRIKNPVGIGVGLGCSSTAIGTARAMGVGGDTRCNEQYGTGCCGYDDGCNLSVFVEANH